MNGLKSLPKFTFIAALASGVATTATAAPTHAKAKIKVAAISAPLAAEVIANYAAGASWTLEETLKDARALREALRELGKTPTAENLTRARDAWKKSRDSYALTEAFRFYGGPIDNAKDGPEGLLNAWPLDESYIDYVEGMPTAGVVNNPKEFPKITRELLVSLNEKNGEKNISTGYHAIEFLLWGQDLSLDGAGQRPVKDFEKSTPNATRRVEYLNLLGDLLVEHLEPVARAWRSTDATNYRATFVKETPAEALRRIYTGVTSLALDEMAGERMTVPLERNDPENEQDCFSDYTLRDMRGNLDGIARVLTGRFGPGVEGPGLLKLMEDSGEKSWAVRTRASLKKSEKLLTQLQDKSFDRVIRAPEKSADRKLARAALESLQHLAVTMAASGKGFGLTLNVE